jgi:hypothetical protein
MIFRWTLILFALVLAVLALSLSALPATAGKCHSEEQCRKHGWTWHGKHSQTRRKEVVRSEIRPRADRRHVTPFRKEVMPPEVTGAPRADATVRRPHETKLRKEVMPSEKRILISLIGAAAMVTAPETQPRPAPRLLNTPDGAAAFNTAVRTRFADVDDFKAVPIPRPPQSPPEHALAIDAIVLIGLLATAISVLVINRLHGFDSGPRVSFPFDTGYLMQKWAKPRHRAAVERREAWEFDGLPWLPWRLTPEWEVMARVAKGKARPLVEFEPA